MITNTNKLEKPRPLILILAFLIFVALIQSVYASPEFSGQTGQPCSACHKDPNGDGTLTLRGERYKADGYFWGDVDRDLWWTRVFRTILGFLHLLFGVVWFGPIVYVHLIIKPQSLIGGMPKSEKLLGRTCILVVGLTGIGLTLLKVQAPSELWTTNFGVIWMVKVSIFLLMVAIAAVATTTIDRKLPQAGRAKDKTKTDGKEGRPAHIVYEGRRYDVTESKLWKNGAHMARHFADTDLTAAMEKAPRGAEVLERVKDLGPDDSGDADKTKGILRLFVGLAYFILVCVFVVLLCVAWWKWGPPIIKPFPAWTKDKAAACLECHHRETPAIVSDWAESTHARNKISCLHCHQATRADVTRLSGHDKHFRPFSEVGTINISAAVSPKDCGLCHLNQTKEFAHSKHANTVEIVRANALWLKEGRVSAVERVTGCESCHGTGLGAENGGLQRRSRMGQGIGRLNPDGSKGDCGACHGRHTFASAMARRPEACGKCHVGPEHPQAEIFTESKHGTIYAAEGKNWNWGMASATWTAGVDYRTPTCAVCHISGSSKLPSNHDVGHRLSWELQAPLTVRPDGADWQAARKRMETICLQCHSLAWVKSHFVGLDQVVQEYNQNYYQPLIQIMDRAYSKGLLDRSKLIDEPLEVEVAELWRRDGRRAKMGAAMMAPDYTWWHGFYELKKRYIEIMAKIHEKY